MKQQPPQFAPGELSPMEADALNRAMVDLYRLIGGFTAAPPLRVSQDETGVAFSLGDLPVQTNFANTTLNYTSVNFTYSGVTSFNFTSNTTLTLSANTSLVFGGTSNSTYEYTAPIKICGWMFWCFANVTFTGPSTVVDWALPATATTGEKVVFRIDLDGGVYYLSGMQFANASQVVALANINTTHNLTILHEDTGSTAAYRFNLEGAAGIDIRPRGMRLFWYDFTSARWRCMNTPAAAPNLTVQDDDGTPSYTAINTIQFDQDDGFALSNPSTGVAKVDLSLSYNTNYSASVNIDAGNPVLSLSIPGAGNYIIWGQMTGSVEAGTTGESSLTMGISSSGGPLDADAYVCYWPGTADEEVVYGSGCAHTFFSPGASNTIYLNAGSTLIDGHNAAIDTARLSYVKLG